jgi:hypothetical protein
MVRLRAAVHVPEDGPPGPRQAAALSAMEHRRAERGQFRRSGIWLKLFEGSEVYVFALHGFGPPRVITIEESCASMEHGA